MQKNIIWTNDAGGERKDILLDVKRLIGTAKSRTRAGFLGVREILARIATENETWGRELGEEDGALREMNERVDAT